jgi:diguanylate cyclase (GGDEF)-like protein
LTAPEATLLLLREDVGAWYDAAARSLATAVSAESVSLALYDSAAGEIVAQRPRYGAPTCSIPQFRFPLETSAASFQVVSTGHPYVSNDPGADPLYDPAVREDGVRSILTVPVQRDGVVFGLIYAVNKPGGFSPWDADALGAMAEAVGVALENVRLYVEERERRVLNESLREVSRALVGTPTQDTALADVLDQMWRVLRYGAAAAVLVEGSRLRVAACRGGAAGRELDLASAGPLREALESRRLTAVMDAGELLRRLGIPQDGRALIAPLVHSGEVLGALAVSFPTGHASGLRERELVAAFAEHAALFLEAGVVLRRERQARARTAAAARLIRLAAGGKEPVALLRTVAPELLALSGADRVVLYLRDVPGGVLRPVAHAGTQPGEEELLEELMPELGSDEVKALAAATRAQAWPDSGHLPPLALTAYPGTVGLAAVPLLARDELVGALTLSVLERPQPFDPALLELVYDMAQQVALGIENARLVESLARMATTDELTQLANRRRFTEALRAEVARARRSGQPLAMVMGDLDHLKKINDTHGHPGGDAAIRTAADAFRQGRREGDLAARLGGEEFALLLPATDLAGAIRAAERVRTQLAGTTVPVIGRVTVSMGVAWLPGDAEDEESLIRIADERLYVAKSSGRNQVCWSQPEPASEATAQPS